jgi:hypothetical protein
MCTHSFCKLGRFGILGKIVYNSETVYPNKKGSKVSPKSIIGLTPAWATFSRQSLGQVFNSRRCRMYNMHLPCSTYQYDLLGAGNAKGGSITLPLTCLTGLD